MGITISCEAGCYSAQDIKFFSELGANRIIFPRDMTLMEMKAAIGLANLPNMEYEAFVFGPRCTYSGAYCTVSHGLLTGPSFVHISFVMQLLSRMEKACPNKKGSK